MAHDNERTIQPKGEFAYFVVDVAGFQTSLTGYDPVIANQTIVSAWLEEPAAAVVGPVEQGPAAS